MEYAHSPTVTVEYPHSPTVKVEYPHSPTVKVDILSFHNVYGAPCDFSVESSQVIPALIRKVVEYPDCGAGRAETIVDVAGLIGPYNSIISWYWPGPAQFVLSNNLKCLI